MCAPRAAGAEHWPVRPAAPTAALMPEPAGGFGSPAGPEPLASRLDLTSRTVLQSPVSRNLLNIASAPAMAAAAAQTAAAASRAATLHGPAPVWGAPVHTACPAQTGGSTHSGALTLKWSDSLPCRVFGGCRTLVLQIQLVTHAWLVPVAGALQSGTRVPTATVSHQRMPLQRSGSAAIAGLDDAAAAAGGDSAVWQAGSVKTCSNQMHPFDLDSNRNPYCPAAACAPSTARRRSAPRNTVTRGPHV